VWSLAALCANTIRPEFYQKIGKEEKQVLKYMNVTMSHIETF
jgi:hypothetical protein